MIIEYPGFSAKRQRGSLTEKVGPLKVTFPSEGTFLTSTSSRIVGHTQLSVFLALNRTVRHISVVVLEGGTQPGDGADMRGQLGHLLEEVGLVNDEATGPVAKLLGPRFPDLEVAFFRRRSRRPALVGALVHTESAEILFAFRVHRGALLSPQVAEELTRSIRIDLLKGSFDQGPS